MFQQRLPIVALIFGLGLILLSWAWPGFVGGRHAWSKQDAQQLQESVAQYHQLKYEYQAALLEANKKQAAEKSPEQKTTGSATDQGRYSKAKVVVDRYAEAEERYRGLNTKLEQAKSGGQGTAATMQWVGIGAIVVGVLGYISMRIGGSS